MNWYKKAAALNNTAAEFNLGFMYQHGWARRPTTPPPPATTSGRRPPATWAPSSISA